jgi:hypothetical protein
MDHVLPVSGIIPERGVEHTAKDRLNSDNGVSVLNSYRIGENNDRLRFARHERREGRVQLGDIVHRKDLVTKEFHSLGPK